MSEHQHAGHPHGDLHNPDTAHEHSDINVRAIIWFVVVLTAIALAVNVAMWGMFRVLQHYERANDPYVTPLAQAGGQPPEPRLQTTPWTDLKQFRGEQRHYLDSYGWVDEKLGLGHVPIARAKELLLKRGIPVRPELADESAGTHLSSMGESNGGRTIPAGQPDKSAAAPQGLAPAPAPKSGGGL